MIFYICVDHKDGVFDCQTSLKDAIRAVDEWTKEGEVHRVDVTVSVENTRRLLGNLGGYAKNFKCVYIKKMS